MSLFLTDQERHWIHQQHHNLPLDRLYEVLIRRARRRAESPGLTKLDITTCAHVGLTVQIA